MDPQAIYTPHEAISFQGDLRIWIFSISAAIAINCVLFLWMPYLIHQATTISAIDHPEPQVNVIRIKQPDSEVKRKEEPPQPERAEKTLPKPMPSLSVAPKLALPFEINPRLPSGPATLDFPDIDLSALGSPDRGAPFSAAHLDSPLRAIVRIPPIYPMGAKRRGVEGWVKVRFVVDTEGKVGSIDIIAADPAGVFEQSVRRCVSGWKFSPGTIEGMLVHAWVETVIRFKLE